MEFVLRAMDVSVESPEEDEGSVYGWAHGRHTPVSNHTHSHNMTCTTRAVRQTRAGDAVAEEGGAAVDEDGGSNERTCSFLTVSRYASSPDSPAGVLGLAVALAARSGLDGFGFGAATGSGAGAGEVFAVA
jgi:hypothetical protein